MAAKSILQLVRRCVTKERRAEIINCWLGDWQIEQVGLLKRLERACKNDESAYQALSALHAVTSKKILAAKNIIELLTNEGIER